MAPRGRTQNAGSETTRHGGGGGRMEAAGILRNTNNASWKPLEPFGTYSPKTCEVGYVFERSFDRLPKVADASFRFFLAGC